LNYLSTSLREKYPEDKLHILVAKRNTGSFTYDGIELGGERVAREIEEHVEELNKEGHTIKKLSVIGYSLGGLIARYAIGLLYNQGVFERIEPYVSVPRVRAERGNSV
jgi:predicted esterase